MRERQCNCGSTPKAVTSEQAPVCCPGHCQAGSTGSIGQCPTDAPNYFCFSVGATSRADQRCPGPADAIAYSTQVIVNGQCDIPEIKPDAEKLVKTYPCIEVIKAVTVDSQEPRNGILIYGKKVLVVGFLELGMEYSDCTTKQKVHFFECKIPFQGLIFDKKDDKNVLFPSDFNLDNYLIHVCVEQLQVEQIDCRSFSKTAILMIWLQHKPPQ